jgi:hypothetical protein
LSAVGAELMAHFDIASKNTSEMAPNPQQAYNIDLQKIGISTEKSPIKPQLA